MDSNKNLSILDDLKKRLCQYHWFFDVGLDQFSRPVVYVHSMNIDIINKIYQVSSKDMPLIHFAGSLTCSRFSYTKEIKKDLNSENKEDIINDDDNLSYDLYNELSELKDICGGNILSDIFYEVHDGKNAITHLSTKFPDIRNSMEKLYDKYGFDIIYDLLS